MTFQKMVGIGLVTAIAFGRLLIILVMLALDGVINVLFENVFAPYTAADIIPRTRRRAIDRET